MRTFAELLTEYMARTGISDAELARTVGVRRQTIFRWKEGLVARPRSAEDVLRCAERLRLTPDERDTLLVAAGFPPQNPPAAARAVAPAQAAQPAASAAPARNRLGARPVWTWRLIAAGVVIVSVGLLLSVNWLRGRAYPRASRGQTLIVVGQFVNYAGGGQGYNVAGRLQAALDREIQAARLTEVLAAVWPQEIRDREAALDVVRRSAARLVIWGEYDSGRVLVRFAVPELNADTDAHEIEKVIQSPAELSTTINNALPEETRYFALLTLGQMYVDRGDFTNARAILTQAATRPPAHAAAAASLYFLMGYVYQLDDPPDPDQAIEAYTRAADLRPDMVSAYNNRGIAALHRGQPGDFALAVADLTRVIAANPDDATVYSNRGTAYLQLGTPEGVALAIGDFDRAITLDPDLVAAYFNRGLAYVKQEKSGLWLADFERVLKMQEDHAGAYNALCWAYALDRQPELALPYCERAVALDASGPAHDSRGIVYAELGRFEAAIGDFETYLAALRASGETAYQRSGPRRKAWLAALRQGRDPFDRATLDQLRGE
ncbi:MAG: hypothetical protein CVU38_12270 [Chloroflexi bacterium HGW-Chloroflexi-1]|nr:MAG: hypothetical protein CVU38_12270 [Chloroflexi bacterium HGW-Chloroflexi-1]